MTKNKKCSTIITVRGIPSAKDKHREKGDFMKKKWFSALAALAVLSFAAAPMNGYAVDEESLDDELAVAVTTEAPVIAGTVVTTDTPPQITSNVSETSMTTTVTDEYGNYIDEEGNITPATTSVSTQTETTMTTTTVTSDALSEEQEKALAELAEKEHGVFGEFERARASILNKIPEDASRMTLAEAKELVNSSDSFKEIYDKLSASQPYPDFIGGSGVTKIEYWLDETGNDKILLIREQGDIIHKQVSSSGSKNVYDVLLK